MAIERERVREREISQGIERAKEETEMLSKQVERKTAKTKDPNLHRKSTKSRLVRKGTGSKLSRGQSGRLLPSRRHTAAPATRSSLDDANRMRLRSIGLGVSKGKRETLN